MILSIPASSDNTVAIITVIVGGVTALGVPIVAAIAAHKRQDRDLRANVELLGQTVRAQADQLHDQFVEQRRDKALRELRSALDKCAAELAIGLTCLVDITPTGSDRANARFSQQIDEITIAGERLAIWVGPDSHLYQAFRAALDVLLRGAELAGNETIIADYKTARRRFLETASETARTDLGALESE